MKKSLLNYVRPLVVCIAGLCLMVFFAACSGVATTTGANGTQTLTIQGKLLSVNQSNHSATFLYNGSQVTVNNLTDAQVAALQPQVNQTVTLQATQTGTNTYTIVVGTSVQVNNTPVATTDTTTGTNGQPTTTTTVAQGTLDFYGKVQSINASSITVAMPNGDAITMAVNTLTKRDEDFANGQPTVGQEIELKGQTNPDGSFTASKFGFLKADDMSNTVKLNTVDFQGVTTSAVGADNVLHFTVGTKGYTFTLNTATTRNKDFANFQAIQNNQIVKVEVLYNGQNGSVVKVENGAD